ncbi:MAG: response regulator transcription factor [Acidobacteriaceae bacterium]|nr:response regulator transcription factor [Acidobacteriaceae bacterium]
MLSETTVLIADDQPIVRHGLRNAIERETNLKVVGEVSNGLAAIEQIQNLRPDIAILGVSMPDVSGLEITKQARQRGFQVKTIVLTVQQDSDLMEQAIDAGANGYLSKDSEVGEFVTAIREVQKGRYYASPGAIGNLLQDRRRARGQSHAPGVKDLTPTERRILLLIADYHTSNEIAAKLYISPRTVDTHRTNICTKLELRGKHALMKFAAAHRAELN